MSWSALLLSVSRRRSRRWCFDLLCVLFIMDRTMAQSMEFSLARRHSPVSDPTQDGRRRLLGSSPSVVQLTEGYATYATYLMQLDIGTPSQSFQVIPDTGSSLLVLYTSDTSNADSCHVPSYTSSKSSTSSKVACDGVCTCGLSGFCSFSVNYADGTGFKGIRVKDSVKIGDYSAPAEFGGATEASSDALSCGIDGIMGLAHLSSINDPTIFDAIRTVNGLDNSFSMCLGFNGGSLVLGGVNSSYYVPPLQPVPIISTYDFRVAFNGLSVGGQDLTSFMPSAAVIDSGTTLMVLPASSYARLRNFFITNYCSSSSPAKDILCPSGASLFDNYCLRQKPDFSSLPTVTFTLGTVSLSLNGSDYLFPRQTSGGDYVWCMGFAGSSSIGSLAILGDIFMQAYYVSFNTTAKQISFAPRIAERCGGSTLDAPSNSDPFPVLYIVLIAVGALVVLATLSFIARAWVNRARNSPTNHGGFSPYANQAMPATNYPGYGYGGQPMYNPSYPQQGPPYGQHYPGQQPPYGQHYPGQQPPYGQHPGQQ